jgi:hypothetical protein
MNLPEDANKDVMSAKRTLSLVFVGIAIGAVTLLLVQRFRQSHDSTSGVSTSASIDRESELRAQYDRQISQLRAENQALLAERASPEKSASDALASGLGDTPRELSEDERRKISEEFRQRNTDAARARKTENLLAAGYSMDQIERLQRRADELAEQFKKSQADQMARGVWPLDKNKDFLLAAVLGVDPTFALKYEIGDAEYERYLTAQKRPISVHVSGVSNGSLAAKAGILPGDEIVSYDNERIFNSVQLQGLATQRSGDPGERVPVTIRRGGQLLQLMVPKGPINFGINQPVSDLVDLDALSHMPSPPPPPPH